MRRALTQFEATAFESDTSVISMVSSSMCVIVSLCVQKYKYVASSQGSGSKSCQYQNFVTEQQKYLSVKWREDERAREKRNCLYKRIVVTNNALGGSVLAILMGMQSLKMHQ